MRSQDADAFNFSSVQNTELPKTTETVATLDLKLDGGKVSVTLPAGRKLDVIGRSEDQLVVRFGGNEARIPYTQTTIKSQIIEARSKQVETLKQQNEVRLTEEKRRLEELEAAQARAEAEKRDILVRSWSWGESSRSYYKAVGEIENESNRDLKNIDVEVIIRDQSGNMIESGSALANDRNLPPHASTTFSVLIRNNGGEAKTAELSFRGLGLYGQKYSYRIKSN
jgi:hypothetical protein